MFPKILSLDITYNWDPLNITEAWKMYLFRAEPPRISLHKPSSPRAFPLPLSHPTPKPPQLANLGHRLFATDFFPLPFRNHPRPQGFSATRCLVPVLPSRASYWIGFIYQYTTEVYCADTPLLQVFRFPCTNFTVAMNTNATVSKHQDIVPSGADDSWRSKQFYSEKATSRKETKILTYPSTVHC